ncbi:MAG: hypothetical protein ACK58Z_16230 [Pseudanabaena sp.]
MGRYCSPWLLADNEATFEIAIAQTTKSGVKYNQILKSSFVVGK